MGKEVGAAVGSSVNTATGTTVEKIHNQQSAVFSSGRTTTGWSKAVLPVTGRLRPTFGLIRG